MARNLWIWNYSFHCFVFYFLEERWNSGKLSNSLSILPRQSVASNSGQGDSSVSASLSGLSSVPLRLLWPPPRLKHSWWQPAFLLTEKGLPHGMVAICSDAGGDHPDSGSRGCMQQVQPCVRQCEGMRDRAPAPCRQPVSFSSWVMNGPWLLSQGGAWFARATEMSIMISRAFMAPRCHGAQKSICYMLV